MSAGSVRRLLVINQYYAPDVASTGQLLAELCDGLARRGLDVSVLTAQPCYTEDSLPAPEFEVLNGVRVHRVAMGKALGRERMRTRLAGYTRFMWGAWRRAGAIVEAERPDAVLTVSNPPLVGLIGARLAARHRLRYLYILYDIHPDVLQATGFVPIPRLGLRLWDRLNRWALGRADAVIVPGDGMKSTLVGGKGVPSERVHVVPNWARPEVDARPRDEAVRAELGVGRDELLLLYSGNMGIMHPLEPILDAAARTRDLPVRYLFVGDGAKRRPLVDRVKADRLEQVTFLPFQPEERYTRLLAAADACFVALDLGLERLAVPSKAYTFLSAARPLITLMSPSADIARMVEDNGCGWCVADGGELASLVRKLAADPSELARRGADGRALYESQFARERVINRYATILRD